MNCSEWKEARLEDVSTIKGGKRLPKGVSLINERNNHPYIRIRDLGDKKKLSWNGNFEYIDDETYKLISRYIVNTDDIIISIVGTIGLVAIIDQSLDNANLTENCVKISNLNKIDKDYLYYYLLSGNGQSQIKKGTVGAVQAKLPIKNIQKIILALPSMLEQKAIADTLSCLDDKIELNNRINKNLEEMAQAIFKRWFVDFEFPDENGNPYKSSGGEMVESELGDIPKGWNIGVLKDIAVITMGQSPKGSSFNEDSKGTVFYQGRTDFGGRFPTIRLYTSEPKRMARKGDILLSVRAPVGDINVAFEDCCIGRGLASIRSMNNHSSYLLYLLSNLYDSFNVYNGEGTVFGSINKDTLNNIKIIIPSCELMQRFENLCGKIDNLILINTTENKYLTNIRDTLLPKLMSGEIRVPCEEVV